MTWTTVPDAPANWSTAQDDTQSWDNAMAFWNDDVTFSGNVVIGEVAEALLQDDTLYVRGAAPIWSIRDDDTLDQYTSHIQFGRGDGSGQNIEIGTTGDGADGALDLVFKMQGIERFRFTGGGEFDQGVGGIDFSGQLVIDWTADPIIATRFDAGTSGANIQLRKSRSGTLETNTLVQDGDTLGGTVFYGADGTNYIPGASIHAVVNGTPGTNDMPGALIFSTTADGGSSVTERMRLTTTGSWLLGTATEDAQVKLNVGGTLPSSGAATRAIVVQGTIPSASTSIYNSFRSVPTTEAAAFTLATLSHYSAVEVTKGSGSSVTTQTGYITDNFSNGTNNYGFRGGLSSGSNKFNLYMDGTADNYLAGKLGIGTSSINGYNSILVGGSLPSSATVSRVIQIAGEIPTSSSGQYIGFWSNPSTAASFTLTEATHFIVSPLVKGSGATVSNENGFHCGNLTAGTNVYGFRGSVSSGTNKWNLYMEGTAANYLEGPLCLKDGITAPSTIAGMAIIYVDTADGDLKVKFGDGTTKTIVVDT